MSNVIRLSRSMCPDCLGQCFFEFNERTGITSHVDDFTARTQELKATGYVYMGHKRGVMTYEQRNTFLTTTPPNWLEELANKEPEYIDIEQEW